MGQTQPSFTRPPFFFSYRYLAPPGFSSALLNLALPEAQDLFYTQFETMIDTFNATRIWFDYNTASRQTHWNPSETVDQQVWSSHAQAIKTIERTIEYACDARERKSSLSSSHFGLAIADPSHAYMLATAK